MFSDIGQLIKSITEIIFFIEVIACISVGIYLMCMMPIYSHYGFILMLCGPVVCWIKSALFYGFGELIDNVTSINNKLYLSKGENKDDSEHNKTDI